MKHVTIREFQHNTSRVLKMMDSGQSVEIRRRNKPVAILSPHASTHKPKMPDFMARLRVIYGDQVLETTHAELINQARD